MSLPTASAEPAPPNGGSVMCPKEFVGTQILNGVLVYVYRGPICGQGVIGFYYTTTPLGTLGGDCPAENCLNPVPVGRGYDDLDEEERRELLEFLHGKGAVFANSYSAPMTPTHDMRQRGMPEYAQLDSPFKPADGTDFIVDQFVARYDQLDGSCTNASLMRLRQESGEFGLKATLVGLELAPDTPVDETARLVLRFGYCDVVEFRGEHYTVVRRGRPARVRRANLNLKLENFWREFHRLLVEAPSTELYLAMTRGYTSQGLTVDGLMDELRRSVTCSNHPLPFAARVRSSADGPRGLIETAKILMEIAARHLHGPLEFRDACEAFGQGVLFDARPPCRPGQRVHMMEGGPNNWKGYHRWYSLFRAVALLGDTSHDWLHVARCIGLAWAIQSEARPVVDSPDNSGLAASKLAELRRCWCQLTFDQLDWAFANSAASAPTPAAIPASAIRGRYAEVQQLLSAAAGDGKPDHDGHGRFWELPWLDFMSLGPIFGNELIAPVGPNRGANSALVAVLRGTLPGVPRMPMSREPLSDSQIDLIEKWIDDGCPEF